MISFLVFKPSAANVWAATFSINVTSRPLICDERLPRKCHKFGGQFSSISFWKLEKFRFQKEARKLHKNHSILASARVDIAPSMGNHGSKRSKEPLDPNNCTSFLLHKAVFHLANLVVSPFRFSPFQPVWRPSPRIMRVLEGWESLLFSLSVAYRALESQIATLQISLSMNRFVAFNVPIAR